MSSIAKSILSPARFFCSNKIIQRAYEPEWCDHSIKKKKVEHIKGENEAILCHANTDKYKEERRKEEDVDDECAEFNIKREPVESWQMKSWMKPNCRVFDIFFIPKSDKTFYVERTKEYCNEYRDKGKGEYE